MNVSESVLRKRALHDLLRLTCSKYSGRSNFLGVTPGGTKAILASAIQSRSAPNKNRLYEQLPGNGLTTVVADPNLPGGDNLTIYPTMLENQMHRTYVVTNGEQTDLVLSSVMDADDQGSTIADIYPAFQYEPDGLRTPRISASLQLLPDGPDWQMLILKKSLSSDSCESMHFRIPEIPAGYARCLTTYDLVHPQFEISDVASVHLEKMEKTELHPTSFVGEPLIIPIPDTADIMDYLWKILDSAHMISLAVKVIDMETGESELLIKNKYDKVVKKETAAVLNAES